MEIRCVIIEDQRPAQKILERYIADSSDLALVGTFRGSGNTTESMLFTVIGVWVIQFPFAWFVSGMESMHVEGLWWSFPVSYVLPALLSYWWFRKGTWKLKKVI